MSQCSFFFCFPLPFFHSDSSSFFSFNFSHLVLWILGPICLIHAHFLPAEWWFLFPPPISEKTKGKCVWGGSYPIANYLPRSPLPASALWHWPMARRQLGSLFRIFQNESMLGRNSLSLAGHIPGGFREEECWQFGPCPVVFEGFLNNLFWESGFLVIVADEYDVHFGEHGDMYWIDFQI